MGKEQQPSKARQTILEVLHVLKDCFGMSTILNAIIVAGQKAAEIHLINTNSIDAATLEILRQHMIIELQLAGITGSGYVVVDRIIQLCMKLSKKNVESSVISSEVK